MWNTIVIFLKNQKNNAIILLLIFMVSSYFNVKNTFTRQHELIIKNQQKIHQVLNQHILFMKRISKTIAPNDVTKQSKINDLIIGIKKKSPSQDNLGFATQWLVIFNDYLLKNDDETVKDFLVLKKNYMTLLSYIVRYNLEVDYYNKITSKKYLHLIVQKNKAIPEFRRIDHPTVNSTGFEIVAL